jgi:hypothetical protein
MTQSNDIYFYYMKSFVHIHYREVADDVTTIDYESSETNRSMSGGLYTALGSLATLGTSSLMRMVEFDPGYNVLGQHIGVAEAVATIGIAGFVYGVDRVRNGIKAIQQEIVDSRLKNSSELIQVQSVHKNLTVQFGNHQGAPESFL